MAQHKALTLALLLGLAAALGADEPTPAPLSDFIVAKVNGEIVTTTDVLKEIGPALDAIERNELLTPREKVNKKVVLWTRAVRDKVEEIIALQAAKKVEIKIGEEELREEYESFVKKLGGAEEARRYADERGVTLADLQETLKRQLAVKRLIMEKIGLTQGQGKRRPSDDVFIRPSEIQRYYQAHQERYRLAEAVKLRQIFLAFRDKRPAAVRELGRSLHAQLAKGADFAALARLYSPGPLGRHGGKFPMEETDGKLVWQHVQKGQLLAEVEQVAFTLGAGRVSSPIEVPGKGVFLIRIEEQRQARVVPFREAQEEIRTTLLRAKVNAKLERVRQQLRAQATIWPPNLFEKLDLRLVTRR